MDEVILLMEIVVEPIMVVMDVDVLKVLVDVVVHNIRLHKVYIRPPITAYEYNRPGNVSNNVFEITRHL